MGEEEQKNSKMTVIVCVAIIIVVIIATILGAVFSKKNKTKKDINALNEILEENLTNENMINQIEENVTENETEEPLVEKIDEIVSRDCSFLENKKNKYVFSCKLVYKERGETVIPLSKNSTMNIYVVFIKKSGNKYDYKVYDSSSKKGIWKTDKYLKY